MFLLSYDSYFVSIIKQYSKLKIVSHTKKRFAPGLLIYYQNTTSDDNY